MNTQTLKRESPFDHVAARRTIWFDDQTDQRIRGSASTPVSCRMNARRTPLQGQRLAVARRAQDQNASVETNSPILTAICWIVSSAVSSPLHEAKRGLSSRSSS